MKNRPVGTIEPILKLRITQTLLNIDYVQEKYLPDPPERLKESVYEVLRGLNKHLRMLVNKI